VGRFSNVKVRSPLESGMQPQGFNRVLGVIAFQGGTIFVRSKTTTEKKVRVRRMYKKGASEATVEREAGGNYSRESSDYFTRALCRRVTGKEEKIDFGSFDVYPDRESTFKE